MREDNGRSLASQSGLSAGVSHAPVRVPASPNTPLSARGARARARARARPHGDNPSSLPGASAFILVVTPRPRPLPEVADRELGARLRAVPDWLWGTSPGGRGPGGERERPERGPHVHVRCPQRSETW